MSSYRAIANMEDHIEAVMRKKASVLREILIDVANGVFAPYREARTTSPTIPILEFAHKYFRHHCTKPFSLLHKELCADLDAMVRDPEDRRLVVAAPRGNAKSTIVSLIWPIYCIVFGLHKYIVIISDTSTQANQFLSDIKFELEENADLKKAFPYACGEGPQWTQDEIVTANGVKVVSLGTGKRIRGRKMRQHRPSLVIIDDLESDEHVRNKEQRDKVYEWLTKAVLKARGVGSKFNVVMVGTVLHMDSVLARLLDSARSPGWRGRKYKAVMEWAERQDLWDEWERIYTDISVADDERFQAAKRYFLEREEEMLRGTKVLWPEGENYYDLMCQRVNEGRASFESEKQNEPISQDECFFDENRIHWFREYVHPSGRSILQPDHGEPIPLSECDIYGACDPSLGRNNRSGDPSAIVSIAAWPKKELGQGPYRSYWVIDCDIRLRRPSVILQDILSHHRRRHYRRFGIESVQFQEFFADEVQKVALGTEGLEDLSIVKLKPHGDKAMRIEKLEPFLYGGKLRLSRSLVSLWNQLRFYPHTDHDDGPDCVELAMETIGAIKWSMVTTEADFALERNRRDIEARSIVQRLTHGLNEEIKDGTCAKCSSFEQRFGRGYCAARMFFVGAGDPACYNYDPVAGKVDAA